MNRATVTIVIAFWLLGLASAFPAEGDSSSWELIVKSKNLTLYKRDIPGSKSREAKAVFEVDAPTWRVAAVVCDFERYDQFMPFTIASKVLETKQIGLGKNRTVFFTAVHPPMISIRYYTLDLLREDAFGGKKGWIRVSWNTSDSMDLDWKDPRVRRYFPKDFAAPLKVTENTGQWLLEPIAGGSKTRVEYYAMVNPEGNLPLFLTDKAKDLMFPKLRDAVIQQVKDPRFDIFAPKQDTK